MIVIKRILIAIRFLTILPLPDKGAVPPKELGKSMAYFPLAGMFIGLILVLAYMVLIRFLSPLLTAVLLVGIWAYFTGALHLEGFVDAADGFSASSEKEKILSVMKDHHVGAKGVIAVVFLIILKIALLNDISVKLLLPAIILAPAIGRWMMVCAAYSCPYSRSTGGFGKAFVENSGIGVLVTATGILVIAGAIMLQVKFFILMVPILFFMAFSFLFVKKKIGGVTGDVLGAMNELAEVVGLSAFLLLR